MNHSTVLSVSRKYYLNCEKVADFLSTAGFLVDVTQNVTVNPNREYGCRIVGNVKDKNEIENMWGKLKDEYKFDCAHLSVSDKYKGCVLDFIEPTKCQSGKCN
jgi:hypothetical protein